MDKKVAVFGDSISKGIVYEDDKLKKLEDGVVQLISDEYGYTIDNYSAYGQTLRRLDEKDAVGKFLSDGRSEGVEFAVFCIGGNDADYNWKEVAASPMSEHSPNTNVNEFEEILERNVSKLSGSGINVILTTIPPVDSARYFKNVICRIADGEKVLEFLGGDVTNISRHQEVYNYVILKVAARNKCPVIDLRTGFLLDKNYLKNYCIDGIHPNGNGHKFMAEEVVCSLAKQGYILKKRVN